MNPANNIVAKINNVPIVVLNGKEKLVPIKPICEALEIAFPPQYQKIKDDDILSSTVTLSVTVGTDSKEREMVCLPLEFVFGWLFTINHRNVKPEAQETVRLYKVQCYHALYKYFTEYAEFIEERQLAIDESLVKLEVTKEAFKNTKKTLEEQTEELNKARRMNFNDWKEKHSQLLIVFPN